EMRVQGIQQGFGDFRELVIQLVVDASAEQSKCFDQAFDVRILARVRAQHEAASSGRILFGELRGHLADKSQLAFVIWEKVFSHEDAPETAMRRESRCKVTSNSTGSAGSSVRKYASI